MSTYSDYLEAAILNHFFRATATAAPAAVYLALFSITPGETGGGTELAGSGYVRKLITFGAPVDNAGAKRIANSVAVMFDAASGGAWAYVAIGVFDAAAGGNMLSYKDLGVTKNVAIGDRAYFDVGAVTVDQT